jgi:CheY-like chemotaxis protein/HPt (histidine-containing phosphotransfer) domain-containing protein
VGSRFSVELALPLAAGSAAADDAAATARAPASSGIEVGPHVLLVEDHPLSQEILTEMLEQLSCEVTIAATGVEALDLAGTSAFDLILMDLQLPGIDGLTATRLIRLLPDYRRTPIVALSANAFREDRARALDAGMNEHVAKPVTAQGLAALLRRWVPQQASGGAAAPAQASPLLGRLAISVADDLTRIRERLAEGDRQQAADIAHGAAGAAALAGAGALAQALMALQRQLGTPQPEAGADEARLGAVALAMDALTEAPARPVA